MGWNHRVLSLQFSVATLLMLMVVAAVAFGWYRDHQKLTAELHRSQSLVAVLSTPTQKMPSIGISADSIKHYEVYASADELLRDVRESTDQQEFSQRCYLTFGRHYQSATRRAMAIDAIPGLLELLNDPDPTVRLRAVATLGDTGRGAHEVVPALINAMNDSDGMVQYAAAIALGGYGEAAQEALPRMMELFEAPAGPGTGQLGLAITKIDPRVNVADRLAELLALDDDNIVGPALNALYVMDPYEAQKIALVPQLATRLQNPDDPHRVAIVHFFSKLPPQPAYEAVLLKVLETEPNGYISLEINRVIRRWHNLKD